MERINNIVYKMTNEILAIYDDFIKQPEATISYFKPEVLEKIGDSLLYISFIHHKTPQKDAFTPVSFIESLDMQLSEHKPPNLHKLVFFCILLKEFAINAFPVKPEDGIPIFRRIWKWLYKATPSNDIIQHTSESISIFLENHAELADTFISTLPSKKPFLSAPMIIQEITFKFTEKQHLAIIKNFTDIIQNANDVQVVSQYVKTLIACYMANNLTPESRVEAVSTYYPGQATDDLTLLRFITYFVLAKKKPKSVDNLLAIPNQPCTMDALINLCQRLKLKPEEEEAVVKALCTRDTVAPEIIKLLKRLNLPTIVKTLLDYLLKNIPLLCMIFSIIDLKDALPPDSMIVSKVEMVLYNKVLTSINDPLLPEIIDAMVRTLQFALSFAKADDTSFIESFTSYAEGEHNPNSFIDYQFKKIDLLGLCLLYHPDETVQRKSLELLENNTRLFEIVNDDWKNYELWERSVYRQLTFYATSYRKRIFRSRYKLEDFLQNPITRKPFLHQFYKYSAESQLGEKTSKALKLAYKLQKQNPIFDDVLLSMLSNDRKSSSELHSLYVSISNRSLDLGCVPLEFLDIFCKEILQETDPTRFIALANSLAVVLEHPKSKPKHLKTFLNTMISAFGKFEDLANDMTPVYPAIEVLCNEIFFQKAEKANFENLRELMKYITNTVNRAVSSLLVSFTHIFYKLYISLQTLDSKFDELPSLEIIVLNSTFEMTTAFLIQYINLNSPYTVKTLKSLIVLEPHACGLALLRSPHDMFSREFVLLLLKGFKIPAEFEDDYQMIADLEVPVRSQINLLKLFQDGHESFKYCSSPILFLVNQYFELSGFKDRNPELIKLLRNVLIKLSCATSEFTRIASSWEPFLSNADLTTGSIEAIVESQISIVMLKSITVLCPDMEPIIDRFQESILDHEFNEKEYFLATLNSKLTPNLLVATTRLVLSKDITRQHMGESFASTICNINECKTKFQEISVILKAHGPLALEAIPIYVKKRAYYELICLLELYPQEVGEYLKAKYSGLAGLILQFFPDYHAVADLFFALSEINKKDGLSDKLVDDAVKCTVVCRDFLEKDVLEGISKFVDTLDFDRLSMQALLSVFSLLSYADSLYNRLSLIVDKVEKEKGDPITNFWCDFIKGKCSLYSVFGNFRVFPRVQSVAVLGCPLVWHQLLHVFQLGKDPSPETTENIRSFAVFVLSAKEVNPEICVEMVPAVEKFVGKVTYNDSIFSRFKLTLYEAVEEELEKQFITN